MKNLFFTLALLGGVISPLSAMKQNIRTQEQKAKKDQSGSAFANLAVAGLSAALSYMLYQEAQKEHKGISGAASKATAFFTDVVNENNQAKRERDLRMTGLYAGSILSGTLSFTSLVTGLRKLFS